MESTKKKILILGTIGFVDVNFVRRILEKENVEITAIGSPDSPDVPKNLIDVINRITFIKGDVWDENFLKKVITGKDIIFNLATQVSHMKSFEDPILDAEINCISHLKLLMAMRDHAPQAVVVYPSSVTVIGEASGEIIDKSQGERPLDIYAANKGVAEKYYRIFNTFYNLKTVVLRFANLYGPYGEKDPAFGFINYFINLANDKESIKNFGDGK